MPPIPRQPVLALALAAVGWLAWGFGREVRTAVAAIGSPPEPGVVWRWRFGDPGPTALGHFLADVGREIPPGVVVALATATGSADQDHFLRQWVAYHLPRHRVILLDRWPAPPAASAVPAPAAGAPPAADYVLAYGTRRDEPWLAEVAARPQGALYRVLPWPGSP
jgi:hypothetical protein